MSFTCQRFENLSIMMSRRGLGLALPLRDPMSLSSCKRSQLLPLVAVSGTRHAFDEYRRLGRFITPNSETFEWSRICRTPRWPRRTPIVVKCGRMTPNAANSVRQIKDLKAKPLSGNEFSTRPRTHYESGGQEFESLCAGRLARSSRWKSDTVKE
jgi:hypothetical protein